MIEREKRSRTVFVRCVHGQQHPVFSVVDETKDKLKSTSIEMISSENTKMRTQTHTRTNTTVRIQRFNFPLIFSSVFRYIYLLFSRLYRFVLLRLCFVSFYLSILAGRKQQRRESETRKLLNATRTVKQRKTTNKSLTLSANSHIIHTWNSTRMFTKSINFSFRSFCDFVVCLFSNSVNERQ